MKGHVAESELAAAGQNWRIEATHPLSVPGLAEARVLWWPAVAL